MDDLELTRWFMQYAELSKQLAEVKAKIEEGVLDRGESVKIAGITATYYKPSQETPDYKGTVENYLQAYPLNKYQLKQFQTVTITTKWKEACEYFIIAPPPGAEKPARVVVK